MKYIPHIIILLLLVNSCITSHKESAISSKEVNHNQDIQYIENTIASISSYMKDSIKVRSSYETANSEVKKLEMLLDSIKKLVKAYKEQTKQSINPKITIKDKFKKNQSSDTLAIKHSITAYSIPLKSTNLGFQAEKIKYNGKSYDVVVVDTRNNNVNIFYRDPVIHKALLTLDNAQMSKPNTRMIMNGGMYSDDLESPILWTKPLGLCVENGFEVKKVDTCKNKPGNFYLQPNGIFLIDKQQKPHIIKTDDYNLFKESTLFASQSGPILLINEQINSLFSENSLNTNIRNGVGLRNANTLVFIISNEPVNFFEFANLFKTKYHCKQALYLDGTISGAIIPALNRDDSKNGNHYAVFISAEPKKRSLK